jgi:hypothetical protein
MDTVSKKRGRKPGGCVRHPGLCSAARELGVSAGHLLLVIEGTRTSEKLKIRYAELQVRRQRETATDTTLAATAVTSQK